MLRRAKLATFLTVLVTVTALAAPPKPPKETPARAKARAVLTLLTKGDVAGAETAGRAAAKTGPDGVAALGKVLLATGRAAEARPLLEEVVKKNPRHLRARWVLIQVVDDLGDRTAKTKLIDQFYDDWDDERIDHENAPAEELMLLALAARSRGDKGAFKDADDFFRDAVSLDPKLLEANLEWGLMELEKFHAGQAEQAFDEVLKQDPKNPDAHAGLARVKLEQGYDYRGALEHIDAALAVNPSHAAALCTRAEIEIDNEEYANAKKSLAPVLAVNPEHLQARALMATIAWLTDDLPTFEAEKKRVLAHNPRYAMFFHIVADHGVKAHRYLEAIDLEKQALAIDPNLHDALAGIGVGYLRMGGEDQQGLDALEKSHELDGFNTRTYNTLNLFDELKKDYTFLKSKSFRLRVPKSEAAMLERYLPRFLEIAFADMVKRYGFTPTLPTTIELFDDQDKYSVRTVGLPNLAALGVCFGRVITAISPSQGNLNWGMILWHELGHVFALQRSGNRVPRWFTEGLSEVETIKRRREWRRENDADVYAALEAGTLPSTVELNTQFVHAQSEQQMVVAYHLSSVTVEFMVDRWGWPGVVKALDLFKQGKDTAFMIKAVTKLEPAAFDQELRAWLRNRFKAYVGTWRAPREPGDLKVLTAQLADKPDDPKLLADVAAAELGEDGARPSAAAHAAAALAKDPKNKTAIWVQLKLSGEPAKIAERGKALVAAGGDGYDVRMELAGAALRAKDNVTALRELTAAKRLDPERSEPYAIAGQIHAESGQEALEIAELEGYVMIEQMEYKPLRTLTEKLRARKEWAKARTYGEMALFIYPYDAELHVWLAEIYGATNSPKESIFEAESALLADPPAARPALAHLAITRAALALKDPARARQAIGKALALEPKNAEALGLQRKVK